MISNNIVKDGKKGMRVYYVPVEHEMHYNRLLGEITEFDNKRKKFTVRWYYDDEHFSYRDQDLKCVDIKDHPSWKRVFIYDTDAEFLALQLKYNVS